MLTCPPGLWKGERVEQGRRTYYPGAVLDGSLELAQGDTVQISPTDPKIFLYIGTIARCPVSGQQECRLLSGSDPGPEQADDSLNLWVSHWNDQETRFELAGRPETVDLRAHCGMCPVVAARDQRLLPVLGEKMEATAACAGTTPTCAPGTPST